MDSGGLSTYASLLVSLVLTVTMTLNLSGGGCVFKKINYISFLWMKFYFTFLTCRDGIKTIDISGKQPCFSW